MICNLDALNSEYQTIRPLSAGAAYLMRRTVALYGDHLSHPATTADLTNLAVSAWLASLERTHAPWTRTGHRVRILSLWRFAARRGYCHPPGEVRRCPPPEPMPEAWSPDQVAALITACDTLPADAAAWFRATVLTCYESGLRRGDVRRIRRAEIRPDGLISIRQHKTAVPHVVSIRPETAALVLALPGETPLACPWGPKKYGALWGQLRAAAGLSTGACQQLRRTGATWVAAEHGMDAARQFLGHRSPCMVRHYVDASQAMPRPWLPPPIRKAE